MSATRQPSGPQGVTGVVESFDEGVGLGTIRTGDGRDLGFHCTQIADGSRRIAAGTSVRFEVRPGHGGRWEAAAVAPADSAG